MKIKIISVGHKMPSWVDEACAEYIKRMPRELGVEILSIKPGKRAAGKNALTVQEEESKKIIELSGKDYMIALDERGVQLSTLELADHMKKWLSQGQDVSIIIGGADGLHPNIKSSANSLIGLSKLTLPHAMVRVLLCEQLYRAWSVINHHPYHRE
jgi:23S rRNA (pseudouridine1915-N3)-methyltransferase